MNQIEKDFIKYKVTLERRAKVGIIVGLYMAGLMIIPMWVTTSDYLDPLAEAVQSSHEVISIQMQEPGPYREGDIQKNPDTGVVEMYDPTGVWVPVDERGGLRYQLENGARLIYPEASLEIIHARVTAYTSSPDETWGDPTITASGAKTGPGVAACPASIPFGTTVIIEEKEYQCEDRTAERFREDTFDIWMETKDEAFQWGVKKLFVVVKTTV